MGKVKAWIMDLEEQFYDKVDESDLCVDSFEEFVAIAKEKIGKNAIINMNFLKILYIILCLVSWYLYSSNF